MTEGAAITLITTLLTGFISIITILLKYRIDNNKAIKNIETLVDSITRRDEEQDKRINALSARLTEEGVKRDNKIEEVNEGVKKLNFSFNKFVNDQQLNNKIFCRYIDLQYDLSKVIVKDIKNEEHNGDLDSASHKIENFKEIVESNDFNNYVNGKGREINT